MARGQDGFTLIEMLVALAVFSLAALALLRLEGVTLRTAADLDAKVAAETVARNIEVATLTDPAAPAVGRSQGAVVNGGYTLGWTQVVSGTGDPSVLRIDVAVRATSSGSPAVLTFVRSAT